MSAQTLKSRAAVAFAPNEPLQLVTIDVAPPKAGEVRVRIVATGVCHTDAFTLSGSDPEGIFPTVLGHEGGGSVIRLEAPCEQPQHLPATPFQPALRNPPGSSPARRRP